MRDEVALSTRRLARGCLRAFLSQQLSNGKVQRKADGRRSSLIQPQAVLRLSHVLGSPKEGRNTRADVSAELFFRLSYLRFGCAPPFWADPWTVVGLIEEARRQTGNAPKLMTPLVDTEESPARLRKGVV